MKGMIKNVTFLRRTDSGKNPVTSSDLGTKLWLSFLPALRISGNDFVGLIWRENWPENDDDVEER
jgi:hypothetical protein